MGTMVRLYMAKHTFVPSSDIQAGQERIKRKEDCKRRVSIAMYGEISDKT